MLTHFVDDREHNLHTVGQLIGCKCFLFIRDGSRTRATAAGFSGSATYPVVPNWEDLVEILLGP
jgi:hypothetical protein